MRSNHGLPSRSVAGTRRCATLASMSAKPALLNPIGEEEGEDYPPLSAEEEARLDAHLAESEGDELVPAIYFDAQGVEHEFNALDDHGNFVLLP